MPDSHSGPLPLADALIAWSDPSLIERIRAEEAKFDPGELDRLGLFTLDSARTRRRSPNRIRPLLTGGTERVERAWDAALDAFRYRVERGEIRLEGLNTLTPRGPVQEALPRQRAAEFAFDVAAGAVRVGIHLYTGVEATLLAGAAAAIESRIDAPASIPHAAPPPAVDPPRNPAFAAVPATITSEQVAALDPEIVAALLEAHAEHVRLGLRVKLLPPGGASPWLWPPA